MRSYRVSVLGWSGDGPLAVVVGLQDVSMVFDERLVSTKEESSADLDTI